MIELLLGFFVLGSIGLAFREARDSVELVPAPHHDDPAAPGEDSVYDSKE